MAAATAMIAGLGLVFAPTAAADSTSDYTGYSPKRGFGYGTWINPDSSTRELQACDEGYPDGFRVVAELEWVGGNSSGRAEAHAAGGTGTCYKADFSYVRPGTYAFRVCLRNGYAGVDQYCSDWWHGTTD